jgi:hypothetical protein
MLRRRMVIEIVLSSDADHKGNHEEHQKQAQEQEHKEE